MRHAHHDEPRRFGIREWMGGGWWAALAFSLVIIFVMRSGTVGAPAQASVRSLDSLPRAASPRAVSFESEYRAATRELSRTRAALEHEKLKSSMLMKSYEGLDEQFHEVTSLVRSAALDAPADSTEAGEDDLSLTASIPTPIEAIYVLDMSATGASEDSH